MLVGDVVRVLSSSYQDRTQVEVDIKPGDIGVIVGVVPNCGDVVEIMINGVRANYWLGLLEVVSERADSN